jgi:Glycosyl transferase family 90
MINIDRFGDEWANQHGSQILNVDYETCRDDTPSCFKEIFEFLGVNSSFVESKEKRFESSFADLHLDESLDHIANQGAVKEALGVNGWNDFVGLDDYREIQLLIYDENEGVAKPHQVKGINSTVYGFDLVAEGFGSKLTAAIPLLRSMHPSTLVVLSNDRDVLINFPSGSDSLRYEAISQFRTSYSELTKYDPNAVVVSAQTECCSVALSHVLPGDYFDAHGQRNELSCTPGAFNCEWQGDDKIVIWKSFMVSEAKRRGESRHDNIYLDAGFIAGTASNLLNLINNLKIQSFEDDRAVLTDYMFRNHDKIIVDYSGKLFGKSLGVTLRSSSEKCKDDDLDRRPRHFSAPVKPLTALFLRRPREVGCYSYEATSVRRFPSWNDEGIEIKPLLDHFNRVLIGKETAALPPAYGRVPDVQQGQEIPYIVDINGIYSSRAIRSRIDENVFQWRMRPTEALVKLAYRTLKRVRTGDEQARWNNLLRSINSGIGFPYWAWYGDYKSCNKNNYDIQSIPLLTTAAKADCDYSFPIPNYMTIIDTQRSSEEWQRVFQEFENKYPWDQKMDQAVWRGSLAESDIHQTFENIRWRLCKLVHESKNPMYDVGLTSISPQIAEKVFVNTADIGGLVSSISPMLEFMKYRAIIDMDGNSWSSRFGSILCFNSVVVKVEPNYTEYFFAELIPWMHYIPVKNDLSDLHDNVAWALNPENSAQVKSIIAAANQFCSQRLTPSNLAFDLLDIWETYVSLLNRFDPLWPIKWKDKKGELFESGSKSDMVQI